MKDTFSYTPPREETVARLEELFREGATVRIASQAAGVPPKTVQRWLREGSEGCWAFLTTYTRLTCAMAEYRLEKLRKMNTDRDWRAHWEILKALEPHDYGSKPRETLPSEGVDAALVLEDKRRRLVQACERFEDLVVQGIDPARHTRLLEACRAALTQVEDELGKVSVG